MLSYKKTSEEEKYMICDWEYDGEYAIYNNPPYEEQKKKHIGFANGKNNFYSFYWEEDFIGFINLIEEHSEVFFGIGVKPGDCNKGYGQEIVRMAIELSHKEFPGKPLYLEVRT